LVEVNVSEKGAVSIFRAEDGPEDGDINVGFYQTAHTTLRLNPTELTQNHHRCKHLLSRIFMKFDTASFTKICQLIPILVEIEQ
jgi:hypothetical protein